MRCKLQEVQIVVQNLAGIVEYSAGRLTYYILQLYSFEFGSGDEFVKVVYIALQMLSVVEGKRLVAYDRGQ